MLPRELWYDWPLGVCNARTWALWREADACLACASCPTCASRSWCLLLAGRTSIRLGGLHSGIWTFLPSGCSPWLVRTVRAWTCPGVRRGAWNAMLPWDWDFRSGQSCAQSVRELSEGLLVYLSQTGQGGQGHAVRPTSGVLRTESFDKGVKVVYGSRWKSVVPSQCFPLRDIGKTRHKIVSSLV